MRLLITGKTRSGKSISLHRLVCHTVRQSPWGKILVLDGKGSELGIYKNVPRVTMLGPLQVKEWADELVTLAKEMPKRYAALEARELQKAAPGDIKNLVIIDEVQIGTRNQEFGKKIRDALAILFEQSAALGDVFIIATQRDVNAVTPAVRHNSNARLTMLGSGFFQYHADGSPPRSGRTKYLAREDAIKFSQRMAYSPYSSNKRRDIDPESIPAILGAVDVVPSRAPATLFLGAPGTGRTHSLYTAKREDRRAVYADFGGMHHRAVLTSILDQCDAVAPSKADIAMLAECAALALRSEPTTLLMDNIDGASDRTIDMSVMSLMNAAADCWLAADDTTPAMQRKLEPLLPRCKVQRLKPITADKVKEIVWKKLDRTEIDNPGRVENRILQLSHGHPATAAALADRVQKGGAAELRELAAPQTKISLMWVVLVLVVIGLFMLKTSVTENLIVAIIFVLMLVFRKLFTKSLPTGK